jgi:phosphohistidine phosphatase
MSMFVCSGVQGSIKSCTTPPKHDKIFILIHINFVLEYGLILRHGEAGKRLPSGISDFHRPLTLAGKKEVRDIAKSLKDIHVKFNLIITSPLKRTYQTASIVAMVFKGKSNIETWDELKPESNSTDLYPKLYQKFKQNSSILIVGHEPCLSNLIIEIVSNGNRPTPIRGIVLKKDGLANVRITSSSDQMAKGELRWLLTPMIMKKIK